MASTNDISRLLLFGNILQHFPALLIHLLPYIADRIVFNSIASCNRDTNEKSKVIVPPWPKDYQLTGSILASIAVWSPDGTRVAYTCDLTRNIIAIVDQRYGLIRRIINNNRGRRYCDLKFSSDGKFFVSADEDGIVALWNNDVVGNYEQLQRWNIGEDVDESWLPCIDISACCKLIVMASHLSNRVVLIGVENGEIIRSLTPQPAIENITTVMFSLDCRAVFICGRCGNSNVIKLWRPYLDDTDEDNLITLWEHEDLYYIYPKIIVSRDKTMIAIQDTVDRNKGWLLSLDNNLSCTVQKLNFPGSDRPVLLQFTPDDECTIYNANNGLKYWSVVERKFIDNKKYLIYTMHGLKVVNFSPSNRQLIVHDFYKEGVSLHMKSIL